MTDTSDNEQLDEATIGIEIKPLHQRWLQWPISIIAMAAIALSGGYVPFLVAVYSWPKTHSTQGYSTFWHWAVMLSGGVAGLAYLRHRDFNGTIPEQLAEFGPIVGSIASAALIIWCATRIRLAGREG